MKLTGKCKEDFEKWVSKQPYSISHDVGERAMNIVPLSEMIEQLPQSMQYGVLVDFFDSVDIGISMNQYNNTYWYDIENPYTIDGDELKSRPEARKQAILKANEIYNESR